MVKWLLWIVAYSPFAHLPAPIDAAEDTVILASYTYDALGRRVSEVFANLGKAGGCPAQSEATCRAISAALRSGVDARELIEQLRAIRCLSAVAARNNGKQVNVQSCPDAIARAMQEALVQQSEKVEQVETSQGRLCPFCGGPMRREAGCFVCHRCCESSCG